MERDTKGRGWEENSPAKTKFLWTTHTSFYEINQRNGGYQNPVDFVTIHIIIHKG